MKKFLILAFVSAICMFAKAEEITSDSYSLYFANTTAQAGSTVQVYIKAKYENIVGSAQFKYTLPEGVTFKSIKGCDGVTVTEGATATDYTVFGGCEEKEDLAVMTLEVSADLAPGNYDLKVTEFKYADAESPATKYVGSSVGTLTIQRAAVIASLGEGYSLMAVPVKMTPGFYADGNVTTMDIYYTAAANIANLSFNINLPDSKFYISAIDGDGNPIDPVLNTDIYNNTAKQGVFAAADDQNMTFTYAGVKSTRSTSQRYIKAATTPTKIGTITFESEADLASGIYQAAFSNISMEEYVTSGDGTKHEGNNYVSVLAGEQTDADPIIYGYLNEEGLQNVLDASKVTNPVKASAGAVQLFSTVDISSATYDDAATVSAKLDGMLVYPTSSKTLFTRSASEYSTICLPYALTAGDNVKYYTLSEASSNSLKFIEATTVPANTPAIFKGTISTSADEYTTLADKTISTVDAVSGITLTGTYSLYSLASGKGYYLSNGNFYGDGAAVAPFRGYFDGSIAGVKTLSILIEDASGIHDITSELSNEDIYNLQGIRMKNAQKGVNIIGGKKVYIKK